MSGVWRVVGAAVFAALASGIMPAQIAPVQLTIEPARLIRGGTAILDISLQIQEGYFVPAQTRGSLRPTHTAKSKNRQDNACPRCSRFCSELPGCGARYGAYM